MKIGKPNRRSGKCNFILCYNVASLETNCKVVTSHSQIFLLWPGQTEDQLSSSTTETMYCFKKIFIMGTKQYSLARFLT